MDVVYASLRRRRPGPTPPDETRQAVDILWAHTRPGDALQHITARSEDDRLDLLLYLLTRHPADGPPCSTDTAYALLARSHRASPLLNRRYQPPAPATG